MPRLLQREVAGCQALTIPSSLKSDSGESMVEALDQQRERLVGEVVAEAWAPRPFQVGGGFGQTGTVVE